jgi:SUF system NifU family Fe-S assembly protein
MSDLRDLYQELIVDHSKKPRNFRKLPEATCSADGYNPLCGDKLKLFLKVEDGVIKDASFEGSGCAISTASASIMTEMLKGQNVERRQGAFRDVSLHGDKFQASRRRRAAAWANGRVRRGQRVSGARQVRHARLAYDEDRAGWLPRNRLDGMIGEAGKPAVRRNHD